MAKTHDSSDQKPSSFVLKVESETLLLKSFTSWHGAPSFSFLETSQDCLKEVS